MGTSDLGVLNPDLETKTERFFQKLDPSLQSKLFFQGELSKYERGQLVLSIGEVSGKLYVLIDGMVKLTRSEHEKHLTLAVLKPGDIFGELSMINGRPTTADIRAMEDSSVLSVERSKVYSMLHDSPSFMCLFLETLSLRTRGIIENICAMALEDVYGRLRRTLKMLASENSMKDKIYGVTHAELAEMVGASREMVSIIMKELKMGNYLRVDGRMITLLKDFPEKR